MIPVTESAEAEPLLQYEDDGPRQLYAPLQLVLCCAVLP